MYETQHYIDSSFHPLQSQTFNFYSFCPDGEIIATASLDSRVKIWNKEGILLRTLTGHKDGILAVTFSPDGTQLISTSFDYTAILWNLKRILNTEPRTFGCDFVRDYLRTNADVKEEDRHLCDGIKPHPSPSSVTLGSHSPGAVQANF